MLVKGGTVVRWLGSGCGFGWRCGLFLYEYTSAHYNDNIIVSLRGNPHICKISLYVEMGQVHGSIEDCRMTLIYSVVMYYKMRKHYYSYDSCISTVHPIWYTADLMCVVLSWLYFHFLVDVCKLFGLLYRRWGNQMNSRRTVFQYKVSHSNDKTDPWPSHFYYRKDGLRLRQGYSTQHYRIQMHDSNSQHFVCIVWY